LIPRKRIIKIQLTLYWLELRVEGVITRCFNVANSDAFCRSDNVPKVVGYVYL